MKRLAKRLLRALGYEVHRYWPRSSTEAQFRRILEFLAIDLVIDVGANRGDFGAGLRFMGYRGHIVSFEPLSDAHAELERAARGDYWSVPDFVGGTPGFSLCSTKSSASCRPKPSMSPALIRS